MKSAILPAAALLLPLLASTAQAQIRTDWKAISVTSVASLLEPGKKVTVKMTIRNFGLKAAPPVLAGISVARDAAGTQCPVSLGTLAFPGLGVGKQHEATGILQLPDNLPSGTCFLIGNVNPAKRHSESSYLNNKASQAVKGAGRADLIAKSCTVSNSLVPVGTAFSMTTEVENDSCVDADATLHVYLSSDSIIDSSDVLLVDRKDRIDAGKTEQRTGTFLIPLTKKPGRYRLIMVVDKDDSVIESIENNNGTITAIDVYVAGSYLTYDSSCAGSSQTPQQATLTLGSRTDPYIGATTRYVLKRGAKNSAAIFTLGFSKLTWGSLSLPLDLTPFGAPGCRLVASPDVILSTSTTAIGGSYVEIRWPSDTHFIGSRVFSQYWSYDPTANALQLAFTAGVETKLGSIRE